MRAQRPPAAAAPRRSPAARAATRSRSLPSEAWVWRMKKSFSAQASSQAPRSTASMIHLPFSAASPSHGRSASRDAGVGMPAAAHGPVRRQRRHRPLRLDQRAVVGALGRREHVVGQVGGDHRRDADEDQQVQLPRERRAGRPSAASRRAAAGVRGFIRRSMAIADSRSLAVRRRALRRRAPPQQDQPGRRPRRRSWRTTGRHSPGAGRPTRPAGSSRVPARRGRRARPSGAGSPDRARCLPRPRTCRTRSAARAGRPDPGAGSSPSIIGCGRSATATPCDLHRCRTASRTAGSRVAVERIARQSSRAAPSRGRRRPASFNGVSTWKPATPSRVRLSRKMVRPATKLPLACTRRPSIAAGGGSGARMPVATVAGRQLNASARRRCGADPAPAAGRLLVRAPQLPEPEARAEDHHGQRREHWRPRTRRRRRMHLI